MRLGSSKYRALKIVGYITTALGLLFAVNYQVNISFRSYPKDTALIFSDITIFMIGWVEVIFAIFLGKLDDRVTNLEKKSSE